MDIYVARQPILAGDQSLWGYELLYRNPNVAPGGLSGDAMTAQVVVNTFVTMGLTEVTRGRPAFINFTREMIVGDYATLLPAEYVVIEVLEDIEPDDEVIAALRRLKEAGYRIAMDDMTEVDPTRAELIALTDIFKVDFFLANEETQARIPTVLCGNGRRFLAEKVETAEVYERAAAWGYDLFQGYFFSKPQLVDGKDVPANKLSYLRLLQQVNQPDLDFDELESIVKSDASLPYRMLRFINSPLFGWRRRIESIRHALVAIGQREFRKWVTLLCLAGLGDDRPQELLVQSVVRAHVCEGLAKAMGMPDRSAESFLVGLFSLFDAIVGRPLEEILSTMPLSEEARAALIDSSGPLADVLESAIFYERGEWKRLSDKPVAAPDFGGAYLQALRTSSQVLAAV